jgi:hypothetical protein
MIARHLFDSTVLRLTGRDLRPAGNWEPLPDWTDCRSELAMALGLTEGELRRCREIADVLDLIKPRPNGAKEPSEQVLLL